MDLALHCAMGFIGSLGQLSDIQIVGSVGPLSTYDGSLLILILSSLGMEVGLAVLIIAFAFAAAQRGRTRLLSEGMGDIADTIYGLPEVRRLPLRSEPSKQQRRFDKTG